MISGELEVLNGTDGNCLIKFVLSSRPLEIHTFRDRVAIGLEDGSVLVLAAELFQRRLETLEDGIPQQLEDDRSKALRDKLRSLR